MMRHTAGSNGRSHAGFTLLELTVSILVLMVVMGAVFSQVNSIQKTVYTESKKVDLTQEGREFVDQFARDVHMSGYPISKLYQSTAGPQDPNTAVGLVEATPTSLRFEGDVYGDGVVYSVLYKYFASDVNDPNCPCLRRSATKKIHADPVGGQTLPIFYTEVQNLIDPAGMSQGLFTYFEANGNPVDVGTGVDINANPATIQQVDAVKVNLNIRTQQLDPQTGQQIVHSIASIAELEN